MGLLDDYLAQQSDNGGGMLGGLPAPWQYQNPETLTPVQKQMMALVGTQNPDQAGFNPLPASNDAFPAGGAAPIAGLLPPAVQPAPTPMAPAAPAFGAGAAPIFATPAGVPGNPTAPAAAPVVAADDEEDDAPAANAPTSPISVGGYQMPRIGPAAAFTPDPAALPANAQPTQGQGLPGPAAPSSGIGGLVSGYQNFMNRGADALASVAKGGSLLGAVRGQYDDAGAKTAQVANLTARALIAKNVDPQLAIAAVQPGNGELLKTLITQTFGQGSHTQETDKDGNVWDVNKQTGQRTVSLAAKDDKFQHVQTGESFGGQKSFGAFNTKTGELKADTGGASGAPGTPGFGSLLAQGVQYDPNRSGPDYMAQFSPEVQSAAKAYINGDIMPTGNARKDSIVTFAKTVAQKYGQDMGVPVSDATYGAKRKMQTDLASSGNSTMGGILSNGESSFKHLAEYTKSAADQGNTSHNFWLGGSLAHAQNYIGNAGGGSDTQGKVKAINDNLGKYGAESTKFYAGTGGGVEERLNALKEMNATTTSGEEAASYAEKEKSLMLDRLNTKFQEIRNTLGEERGNVEIAKHMPDIQKNIATIDANIAKLRGKAPATSAAPQTPPAPGAYVWSPDKGLAAVK